jgi:hypothetical protein
MINFILDPSGGTPFYRQIIDQIKFGIASGSLKTGEQLPTVRALAVTLKLTKNSKSFVFWIPSRDRAHLSMPMDLYLPTRKSNEKFRTSVRNF